MEKLRALIYIDNFRGFSETFFPIYDVNFLVGENSTGKTSFLSLLKIISEPNFLFEPDFNTDFIKLGSFREMVTDGDSFKIGIIKENGLFLLTFKNDNGRPFVYRFSYLTGKYIIHTILRASSIVYKPILKPTLNFDFLKIQEMKLILEECIKEQSSKQSKYKKTTVPIPRSLSPIVIAHIIDVELELSNQFIKQRKQSFFPDRITTGLPHLVWFAPIRIKPKQTYDGYVGDGYTGDFSPEGEHTPYLLDKLINHPNNNYDKKIKILHEFGKKSGLFEFIEIKHYGKENNSPFEIMLKVNGKTLKSVHVGYGVSQILPIIVEMLIRQIDSWFSIQQPEIHLHPKAQAEFGELIFALSNFFIKKESKNAKHCFLIETHSDFLIDRFRVNYLDSNEKDLPTSQVLFFEKIQGENKVSSLIINNKGQYPEDQPKSFREFFIHEELRMLSL